ncbi:Uncharacterised protein [Grimontia hollisae]|nr:Uncharacterised protein [Grimontia hollisae]
MAYGTPFSFASRIHLSSGAPDIEILYMLGRSSAYLLIQLNTAKQLEILCFKMLCIRTSYRVQTLNAPKYANGADLLSVSQIAQKN